MFPNSHLSLPVARRRQRHLRQEASSQLVDERPGTARAVGVVFQVAGKHLAVAVRAPWKHQYWEQVSPPVLVAELRELPGLPLTLVTAAGWRGRLEFVLG